MAVLDLPVPPSVNETRRLNKRALRTVEKWERHADFFVLAAKRRPVDRLRLERIPRFDLTITLSEDHCKMDLDNCCKVLIDYLRRIELIANDAPKNMRRLVVEWGEAPEGVRVEVTPL